MNEYHHYNEKHNFCFNKSKNNQQNVNKKNSTKKCPFRLKKKTRQKSEKKKLPSSHHSIVKQFLLCDVTNNEKDFFLVPCSAIKEKISQKVPQSTENKICSETQENLKLFRKMIVYITSSSCTNQNRCSISYITLN